MRSLRLCLLLATTLLFAGCPKYQPSVNFDRNGFVKQINDHFAAQETQYFKAVGTGEYATAKIRRNELIEDALPFIDEAYMDFITALQSGRDRDNFVADVIELGTTGAVGITKGTRPLQILGVALTAFRGGRHSADLNFYKEQTTPVLINKMDGNRAKVRATILNREKEEIGTYSMGAAVGDIVEYYNAGTLVRAFTELSKDTAIQTKQSEDDVLVLKGVPLTGEATQPQRDLRVGAVKILQTFQSNLAGTDSGKKAAATRSLQAIVATLQKDSTVASVLSNAGVSPQDDGAKILNQLIDIRRSAQLVNNNSLVDKIDQVIIAQGIAPVATPTPSPTPSSSPVATPVATPSPSPAGSPSQS